MGYTDQYVVHLGWFMRPDLSTLFFYRLAFTKAERLPNPNEERWVLDPNPKYVQKVNVSIDPGRWNFSLCLVYTTGKPRNDAR